MVKMVVENEFNGTSSDEVNYKTEYRKLKRKLKMLIYVSYLREELPEIWWIGEFC